MDLTISTWLFLILSCCLQDVGARKHEAVLTVPNGGKWGTWGNIQFCTKGYARGFAMKVQPPQSILGDDTGLNSVRLMCSDGEFIESKAEREGTWTEYQMCPTGNLASFSLSVEPPQGILDDTAANSIQFTCDDGTVLKGEAKTWGPFGPWSNKCPVGSICGIQTKVEDDKTAKDKTALNDIKLFCCA